jgi:hypothetical protein
MKDLTHIKRFNESEENLNSETLDKSSSISDVRSSKKFEVEIIGDGKIIFSDIIDADDLNNAFDNATNIVGVENINLHDEVDINIKEIR